MNNTKDSLAFNEEENTDGEEDEDEEEEETTTIKDTDDEDDEEEESIHQDNEVKGEEDPDNKQISCYTGPSNIDASTIPVAVRLSVKRKTALDGIRQKIPIPTKALPSTSLPAWSLMPLDAKIPHVLGPTGAFILARGKLGQKLHVNKQEYSINDPNHKERVITESYNSLHDPHAKSYLNKPGVRKILMKQGLLTNEGKVICSLQQFNKYRNYLRTVYNQSLEKYINQEYTQFKHDQETTRKLIQYESATTANGKEFIKKQRRERAMQSLQETREEFLKKYEVKQEVDAKRQRCFLQEKLRSKMNTCLIAEERKRLLRERLCKAINMRNMRAQRLKIAVAAKDIAIKQRLDNDRKYVLEAYQHFATEWLLAKFEFQSQRLDRDKAVQQSLSSDLQEKTHKRLLRVEKYRELMLIIQEKRIQAHKRLWRIVRKYFIIWRNKVRARKAQLPDEKHQSLWDVSAALQNTNKYMHDKTGVEKFDDFILSILKLKSSIKAQLEKEEAEAAAAAAAAVHHDDHHDDHDDDKDSDENQQLTIKNTSANAKLEEKEDEDIANLLLNVKQAQQIQETASTTTVNTTATVLQLKPKKSSYASIKRSRLKHGLSSRHITRIPSSISRRASRRKIGGTSVTPSSKLQQQNPPDRPPT